MAATPTELSAKWRAEAKALRTSAQAYKRSCVKDKRVQNLLLAAQLEQCADQLESLRIPEVVLDKAVEGQAQSSTAT